VSKVVSREDLNDVGITVSWAEDLDRKKGGKEKAR
jgi:hypothetical protein